MNNQWNTCYAKSPTIQDTFQPIPGLISCAYAQNVVRWLALFIRAPQKHRLLCSYPSCSCLSFDDCTIRNRHLLSICACVTHNQAAWWLRNGQSGCHYMASVLYSTWSIKVWLTHTTNLCYMLITHNCTRPTPRTSWHMAHFIYAHTRT